MRVRIALAATAGAIVLIAAFYAMRPAAPVAHLAALLAFEPLPPAQLPRALTADEEAYAASLWNVHADVTGSAVTMSTAGIEFMTEHHDPHVLGSKVAPLANAFALDEFRARGLDVPESMRAVQDRYLEAIRLYQEAAAETLSFVQDGVQQHLLTAQAKGEAAAEDLLKVGDVLWPGEHKPN